MLEVLVLPIIMLFYTSSIPVHALPPVPGFTGDAGAKLAFVSSIPRLALRPCREPCSREKTLSTLSGYVGVDVYPERADLGNLLQAATAALCRARES